MIQAHGRWHCRTTTSHNAHIAQRTSGASAARGPCGCAAVHLPWAVRSTPVAAPTSSPAKGPPHASHIPVAVPSPSSASSPPLTKRVIAGILKKYAGAAQGSRRDLLGGDTNVTPCPLTAQIPTWRIPTWRIPTWRIPTWWISCS